MKGVGSYDLPVILYQESDRVKESDEQKPCSPAFPILHVDHLFTASTSKYTQIQFKLA